MNEKCCLKTHFFSEKFAVIRKVATFASAFEEQRSEEAPKKEFFERIT